MTRTTNDLNDGVPADVTYHLPGAGLKLKPLDDPFREKVQHVLYPLEDLLVAKNEAYGNSALDPVNIFSKSTAVEQIKVRIDDKLSRLYHGKEYGDEDTITDLLGYIVLLKIAEWEEDMTEDNE